ncbi:annexin A5-like [Carcharodon carcharias]|uniref:annexin A5-like n=1 Tax=Carcharodon carcharias TaxID=13397 RepID=UPI001B7EDEEF|nr:annexin A5-like [Carcharodon carcharias]XP_041032384.1 annexin A5-like [Carcharodon carcharias]XP_041032385.1 annexin A5-like [Carcharodon carcharias]
MAAKGVGRTSGTIHDFPDFDANQDAETLHKAMKGFGTDEDAILDILATRSNSQRQQIIRAYKTLVGKDLTEDLKSELSGKFESLIVALLLSAAQYDAKELHDALKGAGTSEDVLIEILASRNNAQIQQIVEAYKEDFDSNLEEDITSDTSSYFERVLVSLVQGNRDEGGADPSQAEDDAKALYEAGENAWGTDEERFIAILCSKSITHLLAVFDEYQKINDIDIEDSIGSECSGSLQTALLAIVKCVKSTPAYFAEKLYNAIKGAGTDDNTLIRVMVSRSEVDMVEIKAIYKSKYDEPLDSAIVGDTGGNYKDTLVKLCAGND